MPSQLDALFCGDGGDTRAWWPSRPRAHHGDPGRHPVFAAVEQLQYVLLNSTAKFWPAGEFDRESTGAGMDAVGLAGEAATVKVEGVERFVPAVRELLARLVDEVESPVRRAWANLYRSAAGVGVAEHADGHEVFVVQVGGRKRWTYWIEGGRFEVDLRPGSVLFLPRGVRHMTQADEESLSVSLALACYSVADFALEVVERVVRAVDAWDVPLAGVVTSSEARVQVDRMLQQLADLLEIPTAPGGRLLHGADR